MKAMILFMILIFTAALLADTVIPPGDVNGNWTSANSPYLIEGEITVPDGEALTIEPGVLVEFQGHYKFHIQGQLLAIGTISENIVFTINDTTGFYDFNLQEGAWQGIRFNNTPATNDSSKIVFCKIEYGKANGFDPPCSGSGGAIYVENFSKLLIQNSDISNNMAMKGGGIAIDDSDGVIIQNTLISANECMLSGGGINLTGSSPVLHELVLQDNKAGRGGGIACWYDSNPVITNSNFINNDGTIHGGGIFCNYDSDIILTDVVFKQNIATYGAAMNFQEDSTPIIVRALITDNHASYSGAFTCGYNSNPIVINSTICNNTASNVGGVSYIYDSHPVFINTIIWNNTPEAFQFTDFNGYSNSITCTYSDIEGGEEAIINSEFGTINWLEGNIDYDPIFNDPSNHDFTLGSNSPCIDAGTAFFEWNNETIVDMDFEEYSGTSPDMGAFEYFGTDVNDELISSNGKIQLSNYPNPFNPSTTISFNLDIDVTEETELAIYNLKGQKIKSFPVILGEVEGSSNYEFIWNGINENGNHVSSGVYLFQLKTEKYTLTNKMLLMK